MSAGGVERFLHGLVGGFLRQSDPAEWQFDLLLWPTNSGRSSVYWPDHLRAPNVRVWSFDQVLSTHPVSHLFVRGRLWERLHSGRVRTRLRQRLVKFLIEQWASEQRPDVAYFSYPYAMPAPHLRVPMVATPHDFNFKHPFSSMTPANRRLVEGTMPGWMERCRTLIVSSDFIASEVARYYPRSAPKTRVIRLGIPDAKNPLTPEQIEAVRARLKLPPEFLLTVGWVVPHKNQQVLFEALGHLREQGITLPLVSVGPNSQELEPRAARAPSSYVEQVVRRADALGLQYGRDYLGLGYVTDEELEALYRAATMLVMPTLYEAGSFPIREALRLSCPVAASRIPVLEEEHALLEQGFALFDPHDSQEMARTIAAQLASPAATRATTERAQQRVAQVFNWDQTALGYLAAFREAAQVGRAVPLKEPG